MHQTLQTYVGGFPRWCVLDDGSWGMGMSMGSTSDMVISRVGW